MLIAIIDKTLCFMSNTYPLETQLSDMLRIIVNALNHKDIVLILLKHAICLTYMLTKLDENK